MNKPCESAVLGARSAVSCPSFFHFSLFLLLVMAVAAALPAAAQPAPATTLAPTGHPLVAEFKTRAPIAGTLSVEFGEDRNYGRRTSGQKVLAGQTVTTVVAGMKANTLYYMRSRIDGPVQSWTGPDHTFTTGSLPEGTYPQVSVTRHGLKSPGEGVDIVSDIFSDIGAVVFDNDGSIIWYYYDPNSPHLAFPLRQLPNGHFMVQYFQDVREVDLEGNIIRELTMDQLNAALTAAGYDFQAGSFHHDVLRLDNGHLIVLVGEYKWFDDLPGYPGWTDVLGDDMIDVDPNNNVVWVWRAFDHLDVNRHPYLFPDWTHCNAMVYTPDHNLILSCRHQSWVMKVQYLDGSGNGDVLWHLGFQGDFTLPVNDPTQWFYNQHYPVLLSSNGSKLTLMLYDNGDQRPYNGEDCYISNNCYSRGVIFNLDEAKLTANIAWQYKLLYSFWGGSITQLPNGNIEMDSTSVLSGTSQVYEVKYGQVGSPIWTMTALNAYFYRAYRVPSLYPGVQW